MNSDWTADRATAYANGLLEGQRVRLRRLHDADLPTLESWWYEPMIGILNTAQVRVGLPEATFEMFREWSANKDSSNAGFCVERKHDGVLAGHVSLWGATAKDRAATFGVVFGPDFVGQGLGTEAIELILAYGFLELGLNRISLQVWAYNDRAIAAYHRAGFVDEGRIRQTVWHDGRFHDELAMGLLAAEWRASHSR